MIVFFGLYIQAWFQLNLDIEMLKSHNYRAHVIDDIVDYRKNGVSQFGSRDKRVSYGSDVLETVNNPNYQVQIAKRIDAGSPYLRRVEETPRLLSVAGYCIVNGAEYSGRLSLMPSTFTPSDFTLSNRSDLVGARDQALGHVKNKLRSKAGKFDSFVPIAEARELHSTYRGMVSATEKLIIGLATAKRRITKNPKKAAKDFSKFASDAWLTYSFGLAPTVSDFEGIASSITSRLSRAQTIRDSGVKSSTFSENRAQDFYVCGDIPGGAPKTIVAQVRGQYQYTLTYCYSSGRFIDFDANNSAYSTSDQFGVSWGKLVPAAYELIPFSWLADYFTTAGNVVNDVFDTPSGTTVYNYLTVYQDFTLSSSVGLLYGKLLKGDKAIVGGYPRHHGTIIRRTRLSQLPYASLRIKTFDEVSTNAGNRLRNLFALAQPILGRRLR